MSAGLWKNIRTGQWLFGNEFPVLALAPSAGPLAHFSCSLCCYGSFPGVLQYYHLFDANASRSQPPYVNRVIINIWSWMSWECIAATGEVFSRSPDSRRSFKDVFGQKNPRQTRTGASVILPPDSAESQCPCSLLFRPNAKKRK